MRLEKLRVLLVTNEDPGNPAGGLGEYVRRMRDALVRISVDARVLLICYKQSETASVGKDAPDYVVRNRDRFPVATPEGNILRASYGVFTAAVPILGEFRPHVIQCNDRQAYFPFRGLPNTVFAMHLAFPHLVGLGGIDDRMFQEHKIDRHALGCSPVTVVFSQFMRQRIWNDIAPGASPVVLPLGGGETIEPAAKPHGDRPRVVSFFGRFVQTQKGILDYLKAVEKLVSRTSWAGSIEFRAYGRGKIPERFRLESVQWKGFVQGADRMAAYRESDVVVMPSKYEPFGLVGLEAMGAGCLLVATTGLGMDEFIAPGENAIGIESSADSIAAKLEWIWENWRECAGLIEKGREEAARWTWERSAREHRKIYEAVRSGASAKLRISNSRTYARQKSDLRQYVRNGKSGVTRDVLTWCTEQLDPRRPVVVWDPDSMEAEWFTENFESTRFVRSWNEPNMTLETMALFLERPAQLVIIAGFEYALDAGEALKACNELECEALIIGFDQGPPTSFQLATLDDEREVDELLDAYDREAAQEMGRMRMTRWSRRANYKPLRRCRDGVASAQV